MSDQHLHILAKMPVDQPRAWAGTAKRHSWFMLREHGWSGKLWGKRSKATPVRTQQHQHNAYKYIGRHALDGAWVWLWTKEK